MKAWAKVKYYVNGEGVLCPYDLTVFDNAPAGRKRGGFALIEDQEGEDEAGAESADGRDYGSESRRRALRACRDYGMCTSAFCWFVTLTVNPEALDRYDYKAIMQKANQWLDNRVRRQGLAYLLVPEFHKDGAIHFHGLINDALYMEQTGVKQKGAWVYNLHGWEYGFTVCKRIRGKDGRAKMLAYVIKYISKGGEKVGGRWYLHGGALSKPVEAWTTLDWDAVDVPAYEVAKGRRVKSVHNESTVSELLKGAEKIVPKMEGEV